MVHDLHPSEVFLTSSWPGSQDYTIQELYPGADRPPQWDFRLAPYYHLRERQPSAK